jgi:ketopantoate reductase
VTDVLILGASYGSLFGTKLLMAGHRVSLVCTKPTADLINREGTIVRFPIKGRSAPLDIPRSGCRERYPRRRPTPSIQARSI